LGAFGAEWRRADDVTSVDFEKEGERGWAASCFGAVACV
jgi:hypothetical protein